MSYVRRTRVPSAELSAGRTGRGGAGSVAVTATESGTGYLPDRALATPVPVTNDARVLDVERERLVARLTEAADGPLYSVVEYDPATLNVVYADESTLAFYRDRDHLVAYFDRVRAPARVDFGPAELFADGRRPVADRVDHATPTPAAVTLLRVANDRNGVFVALSPDEPLGPVVEAIEGLCRRPT